MSFKKPFRAVPIREGKLYRARRLRKQRSKALRVIVIAALVGIAAAAANIGIHTPG